MGGTDHSGPKQEQGDVFAKKTSVKFSGRNFNPTFKTTNGLVNSNTREAMKSCAQLGVDRSFVSSIKANHFDYGDVKNNYAPNSHFQTISKNVHGYKGDA